MGSHTLSGLLEHCSHGSMSMNMNTHAGTPVCTHTHTLKNDLFLIAVYVNVCTCEWVCYAWVCMCRCAYDCACVCMCMPVYVHACLLYSEDNFQESVLPCILYSAAGSLLFLPFGIMLQAGWSLSPFFCLSCSCRISDVDQHIQPLTCVPGTKLRASDLYSRHSFTIGSSPCLIIFYLYFHHSFLMPFSMTYKYSSFSKLMPFYYPH